MHDFSLSELPLFKKDLKDFFGPKKILFFRLKYLKVKKKILPDLAGFSVKCVKLEKKSYFRDEISRVLNTLNREKKSFSFFLDIFARAARKFFQYICHFLNDFLRKRRAQRENFFHYICHFQKKSFFVLFPWQIPCRCLNILKSRKKSYFCFFASEKKILKKSFFFSQKKISFKKCSISFFVPF